MCLCLAVDYWFIIAQKHDTDNLKNFNSSVNFKRNNYRLCTLNPPVLVEHASAHAGTAVRVMHFNLLKPSGCFTYRQV